MQEPAELSDSRHGAQGRRENSTEAFAIQVLLPNSPHPSHRRRRKEATGPPPGAPPRPAWERGWGCPKRNGTGEVHPRLCINCPVIKGRLCGAVRLLHFVLCPDTRLPPRSASGLNGGKGPGYLLNARRGELGSGSGGQGEAEQRWRGWQWPSGPLAPAPPPGTEGAPEEAPGSQRSGPEHRAEERPLSKASFTSRSKLFFLTAGKGELR